MRVGDKVPGEVVEQILGRYVPPRFSKLRSVSETDILA